MRAKEFIIVEYRDRLFQYVKSLLPTWPDYVLKDWLVPNKGNFSNLPTDAVKNGIMEKVQGAGLTADSKWQLVPDMKFTMDMFDPKTKQLLIGRAGGSSDLGMGIPKDKERHATQAVLAQQQGGIRKEPVLLIKSSKGYELLEGWHRTIQHFVKYPDGYVGPAYVVVAQGQQGVAEGKLVESAVFLNPNTVVVGQAHGQPLDLSPDTLKKVQAIAAKHGAYYEGNGTDRSYTKGQIDRYTGSWDDEVAKTASPNDPKWLYVLFANVDENNRIQRVGVDPKDTIFNRLLAGAQDNSFQGIGYTAQALQKFLQMSSEGKYDFVKMSQQPATQPNLTRFLKAGEALMWPSNWEQYPNRAGKIAKAATVDVRDQYLATRKAGVYVTGSGHLKAVQNITGKQGVAEGRDDKAEAYRAHLIKTLPQIMKLFANIGKGWIPSKEQMLSAVDTAYIVMKHTGDAKQAGKVLMDELNTLYRMSQGKQDVAEGFSNDMSTEDMIAYLRQHHNKNLHQDYLDHINTFNRFVLQNIPVNSIKTDLPKLDAAKVEQYKQMDFSKAPPIVIGGGYILDGYHRANVAKALGIPTIKAYVGVQDVAENMDHSKDSQAVPELKAALLAKKQKLQAATDDQVYDTIDSIMTRIAKSHGMSGQKLHDMWVNEYNQIPDTWIMK